MLASASRAARRYLLAGSELVFAEGSAGAGMRCTEIFAVPVLLR